jgi:hypothetical protein
MVSRDSSVCIATDYGLDGPGIEFRWGRDFPHLSIPAAVPTQIPIQWIPGLYRGKAAGAWRCTPTKVKERVTSTPRMGLRGLLQGELCVYFTNLVDGDLVLLCSRYLVDPGGPLRLLYLHMYINRQPAGQVTAETFLQHVQ